MAKLSLKEWAWLAFYQGLFAGVSILGAGAVPFLARKYKRIDDGVSDYFGGFKPIFGKKNIWIHGVSMGESLVACGVAAEIIKRHPDWEIGFTTTHPDVLATVRKKKLAHSSGFFPLDNVFSMNRALSRWKPDLVLVAETDFWPVFSFLCNKKEIPLLLINGRISEKIESFYSKFPNLANIVFGAFSRFLVQSDVDSERLVKIGAKLEQIEVVGNLKADLLPAGQIKDLSTLKRWKSSKKLLVYGSVHPSEFKELLPTIKNLNKRGILQLIAPRNLNFVESFITEITSFIKIEKSKVALKSKLNNDSDPEIVILDTMGELSQIYGIADLSFVGGSLDPAVGGHNPLEVLQQNSPLIMGPNVRNFADIIDQLKKFSGIKVVKSPVDSNEFWKILDSNEEKANMIAAGSKVLNENRGGLEVTIQAIEDTLNKGLEK